MDIKTLRAEINAAHAKSDMDRANALQAQIHEIYIASAEQFMKSSEHEQWLTDLMNRP